jgi:hypothetical protein
MYFLIVHSMYRCFSDRFLCVGCFPCSSSAREGLRIVVIPLHIVMRIENMQTAGDDGILLAEKIT